MTAPFRGVMNLDVRDSVPDWAPNVLCIVLDEWTVRRFELLRPDGRHPRRYCRGSRPGGLRDNQWHPTALCFTDPARDLVTARGLVTGRNHTTNAMACLAAARRGFPNGTPTIYPPATHSPANRLARGHSQSRLSHARTCASWSM
jgi:hypothetical protein